jgi:hypothetical protein
MAMLIDSLRIGYNSAETTGLSFAPVIFSDKQAETRWLRGQSAGRVF